MRLSFPVISFLISFAIFSYGINLPFAGQHDWNSVMYANVARNNLRYGLLQTKLGMATNFGPLLPGEKLGFFTHYPPLMPLLLTVSFAIFGIHEWSGRLVPILSVAMMIFFFNKFAQRYWGQLTAAVSSLILIILPMSLYYSKIPVHETVVLGFIGLTIWSYGEWLATNKSKFYYLTLLGLILSQLTSWAGFYLSLYLPLHYFFYKRRILWPLVLPAPIIFFLHSFHMYLLVGSKLIDDLKNVFLFRFNVGAAAQTFNVTTAAFLSRQAGWISLYFTRLVVALTILYLLTHRKLTLNHSFVVLLALFGFTHNIIFRNLAYIHDYMLIYASPFFAISAAIVIVKLYDYLKRYLPFASAIIILLLFLTAIERVTYLKQLFAKGNLNPAVPLGKILAVQTQPNDKIIVASTKFMYYYDVFIRYYSDRRVSAADTITTKISAEADYLVIPYGFDSLSLKDKQYLYDNFKYIATNQGIIFKLKS